MQRHEPTSESNWQIISTPPRFVYPKYWKQKFNSLSLISFKIHCVPFSPTAETHDYNEIDEFTQRQQTAAKKQSHVSSDVRWKKKQMELLS